MKKNKQTLYWLQETINYGFKDKCTTAIQLVPNMQWSQGRKFIFTSSGEILVSVEGGVY